MPLIFLYQNQAESPQRHIPENVHPPYPKQKNKALKKQDIPISVPENHHLDTGPEGFNGLARSRKRRMWF
ncbi:MAG: hypothetical protein U5K79_25690 [Cyclobacteriaceae bacterium]|nr:hypothetical protein [Cyclobacteriaceae bacterium]